ncbi:MAG: TonB-dependent receptor [Bacteroidota bacterium]|nr:TonB-dependent receptor [Bacteroidota bacterium]
MKNKVTRVLLLFFFIFSGFLVRAQTSGITLEIKNKTILEVMQLLEKDYALKFIYSSDKIDVSKEISMHIINASLENVLKKMFVSGSVLWQVRDHTILLYPNPNQLYTLSGYVREQGTGELLIGVMVGTNPVKAGCITNAYGFYSITVPEDTFDILFLYLGYKKYIIKDLVLHENTGMDITLENASTLNDILVKANLKTTQKSLNNFEIPTLKINEVPMLLGEKDIMRYIMLLPGIQKGNEGSNYLYVRGGGMDQNLVLMDDAIIYHAYHLFGISSLFSGNELRRAEIIKGGFSAKYGGRLSSVVDLSLKDGNREKLGVEASLGVISSKLQVEGPLQKNKSSFFISTRRSYISEVSGFLAQNSEEAFNYNFYDLHAKLSFELNAKNRLILSGFIGNDFLSNKQGTIDKNDGIGWNNKATTIRWNHQYNGRLFSNTSLVYSFYNTLIGMKDNSSASNVGSGIQDYSIKHDIDYLLPGYSRWRFGLGSTRHTFTPKAYLMYSDSFTNFEQSKITDYIAWENHVYAEFDYQPNKKWKTILGLRLTNFISGPKFYLRPEPRINSEYDFGHGWFVHANYSLMNQYTHLVSSGSFGITSDIWLPASEQVKPQQSHLFSLGFNKNNMLQLPVNISMAAYYKYIYQMVGLKDGTSLLSILPIPGFNNLLNNWNELITQGKCEAYGTELMLSKEGDHFSGWLSYTLSKTNLQFDDVNRGISFPATYDRRHDFGIYLSWHSGKHFRINSTWIYGTGNAVSLPSSVYFPVKHELYSGTGFMFPILDYESKNAYRMAAFHRLDVSMQYISVIKKHWISTIELSVFNVYNRANPYYYQLSNENADGTGKLLLKQISFFPVMPSISWTLKY